MAVIENKNYNIKHSVNISTDQSPESVKRSSKRIFRWTSQMIEDLLLSLNNFKSIMDYMKGKSLMVPGQLSMFIIKLVAYFVTPSKLRMHLQLFS